MPRYIDADKLIAEIEENINTYWNEGSGGYYLAEDALNYSVKTAPTADVVPKSEEGAECPTCHGTGRIGTTDWLTKNISKKQLAEEKAEAIAEHERYIKQEYAREIFEEIEGSIAVHAFTSKSKDYADGMYDAIEWVDSKIDELKKKYTEDKE